MNRAGAQTFVGNFRAINRIAIISTITRIAIITTINRIAIITTAPLLGAPLIISTAKHTQTHGFAHPWGGGGEVWPTTRAN